MVDEMRIRVGSGGERIDFGVFYVESDGEAFPSRDWEDFHLSFITYWIREVLANEHRERAEFEIAFTEGPYALRCQKNGTRVVVCGVCEESETAQSCFSRALSYAELKAALRRAAEEICSNASRGLPNHDDELRQLMDLAAAL